MACLAQAHAAMAMKLGSSSCCSKSSSATRRASGLSTSSSRSTTSFPSSSISTPMPPSLPLRSFALATLRFSSTHRRSPTISATATDAEEAVLKYDSLLVTLISAAGGGEANSPSSSSASSSATSSSSRASLATAGALARANNSSSVTVLLVDEVAPTPEANAPRLEAIAAALQASGADPASVRFLEKALDAESSHNASVAVGDAADECRADLLILHSDAVHAKRVDANLLAEFVDCPLLLLP